MGTVFVSYEKHDAALAEDIVAFLEGQGIPCWIAPRDISSGEDYGGEITRAIRNASIVVLVGSDWTRESIHVRNEVGLAFREGLTIIPYCAGDCELGDSLDFFLATTHRVIPTEEKSDDFAAIAELVRSKSGFLPSLAVNGKHSGRWRSTAVIALAVLAAAMLILWLVMPLRTGAIRSSTDAETIDYVADAPQNDRDAVEDTVSDMIPPVPQAGQAPSVPGKVIAAAVSKPSEPALSEAASVTEPVVYGAREPEMQDTESPAAAVEEEAAAQESLVSLLSRTRVMADLETRLKLVTVTIDTDAAVLASSYLLISDPDGYIKSVLSPVGGNGMRTNLFTGMPTDRVKYTKSDRVSYIHE